MLRKLLIGARGLYVTFWICSTDKVGRFHPSKAYLISDKIISVIRLFNVGGGYAKA